MSKFRAGVAAVFCLFALAPLSAKAQTAPVNANVVASCGTVNGAPYAVGSTRPVTVDTNGNQCGTSSGGSGGTVTANQGTGWPSTAAQGSTTSGQTGTVAMTATTTAPPTYTTAQTNPVGTDTHGGTRVVCQDTSGTVCDFTLPTIVVPSQQKPNGSTQINCSATGTTAATACTLAGTSGKTTYICSFSIRANATAAATGNATVAGTLGGTMNFTQWTAPLASGIGTIERDYSTCYPASATNTGIVITSAAPGTGGVVSVSATGFQL